MKYSIKKFGNKRNFREIEVFTVKTSGNLYFFIGYTTPKGNIHGASVFYSHGEDHITAHISHGGNDLHVRFIPESEAEKKLIEHSFLHQMSCDYCDTQFMLMPSIKTHHWDKKVALKQA